MNRSSKSKRQNRILELIRTEELGAQAELVERLKKEGFDVNQSSVSRDLVELGVIKVGGVYQPSQSAANTAQGLIALKKAGDSLIVALCEPGWASAVSAGIDDASIEEIVGTIAGDDTIFIAVDGAKAQHRVIDKIQKLFSIDESARQAIQSKE